MMSKKIIKKRTMRIQIVTVKKENNNEKLKI